MSCLSKKEPSHILGTAHTGSSLNYF